MPVPGRNTLTTVTDNPRGGGALPYLGVLGMCRWTGCLFELPALARGVFLELPELGQGAFFELPTLGTRLACILLIFQAIISRIP